MTFHDRPPHPLLSSFLSLGATSMLIVLLVWWLVTLRVRRRQSAASLEAPDALDPFVTDVPERVG